MKKTIFLIRHGETDWNREKRIQGDAPDAPGLNETGKEQAKHIREWLAEQPIKSLYSSPVKRARETTEIAWKGPVTFVTEFVERGYGVFQRKRWDDIKQTHPDVYQAYQEKRTLPGVEGAESLEKTARRVTHALRQIAETDKNETVAIITHGIVIKLLVAALLDAPLTSAARIKVSNGSVSEIEYNTDTDMFKIVYVNNTGHLKPAR